jgi:hypothetical protein
MSRMRVLGSERISGRSAGRTALKREADGEDAGK